MRKKMIGILAAAMVILTTAAFGAIKEGSFSVSPLVGAYIYKNDPTLDTTLLLGLRGGYNFTKNIGIEAVYDYATSTSSGPLRNIGLHRFGGQALYHFMPDNDFVPYVAAGLSGLHFKGAGLNDKNNGAFDFGVGAKYFMSENCAVRGDIRNILYGYDSKTSNNVEILVGAYYQFGAPEPVAKAVAAEPVPEPARVVAAPAAAPEVKVVEAPAPEPVKAAELPAPAPLPEPAKVVVAPAPPPEPVKVAPVPVPEPVKVVVAPVPANHFCNKPAGIGISFDTNKSDIKPKFFGELDRLGNFLKEFPTSKGTIEGHTDSAGNKEANRALSQSRAESVRNYIIKKFGIDNSRIAAKGYGSSKPIASNKSAAGKAKNRRIEAVFTCE